MMKLARGVGASRADFLSWRTEVSYVVVERVCDSLPSPQTNLHRTNFTQRPITLTGPATLLLGGACPFSLEALPWPYHCGVLPVLVGSAPRPVSTDPAWSPWASLPES